MKAKKSFMAMLWPLLKQNIQEGTRYFTSFLQPCKQSRDKGRLNLKALEQEIIEAGKKLESSRQKAERYKLESTIPRIQPDGGNVVKYHNRDNDKGEGSEVQMNWRDDEDEEEGEGHSARQRFGNILRLMYSLLIPVGLKALFSARPADQFRQFAFCGLRAVLIVIVITGGYPAKVKAQEFEFTEPETYTIGDKVPDVIIGNLLNSKTNTINLSDYKGKLLILDFWATWCNYSTSLFNKEDSLEQKFKEKLAFLPVSYQSNEEINRFLRVLRKNSPSSLPAKQIRVATGDKVLRSMFPHVTLPHFVWIGPDGIVKAITGFEDLTEANIARVLSGQELKVPVKKEIRIPYDPEKPILVANNGGDGSNMFYHSVFTGYTEGLKSEFRFFRNNPVKGGKITCSNQPLQNLYKYAFGNGSVNFGDNRISIEVKDPGRINSTKSGLEYVNWLKQGNGYCYELLVQPPISKNIFQYMVADLDRVFVQYDVKLEKRKTQCLALIRTSRLDKLKSKGGTPEAKVDDFELVLKNAVLFNLTNPLDVYYLQGNPLPIIDDTGYTGPVDMHLNASMKDVDALNKELAKYDLKFEVTEKMIDILVIRDRRI